MKKLKVCVDKTRPRTSLPGEESIFRIEMAIEAGQQWDKGQTLRVRFLDGTDFLQKKVKSIAKKWEKYANIKFRFIKKGDAEIRISFTPDIGSWSYVGKDNLTYFDDQTIPTMNFGWFDETTTNDDFNSTILHEFGHALGCVHEHQHPDADIKWNKPYVYKWYHDTQTPPWTKKDVDEQVFTKYSHDQVMAGDFDPESIMLYPIDAKFTLDGYSTKDNTKLSAGDIAFISKKYPKP